MRGTRWASIACRPLRAAVLLCAATCLAGTAFAETLLVVRKSGDALDFVDPGSGLQLASVPTSLRLVGTVLAIPPRANLQG